MMKGRSILLTAIFACAASCALASTADEYLRSAQSQMDGDNPGGAIENFKRAVELDPDNPEALLGCASSEILAKHDLPQAKSCLDRYTGMMGEDERAHRLLAVYSFYVQNYTAAVKYFDGLIDPGRSTEPIMHYLRGESFFRLERYSDAVRDFSRVLEM